ncbi:MAG: hypothetical protein GX540_04355 [Clostridiales bacterium]|nr:hypothetical protein [Clostridiales bacterium]
MPEYGYLAHGLPPLPELWYNRSEVNQMNLPLWLEITVAIVAVLGFLMSLILAIKEVVASRIRFSLTDGEYYLYSMPDGAWLTLRLTVSNLSSRSVSLCAFQLEDDDGNLHSCSLNPQQILGIGTTEKHAGAQLRSDALPVYLAGRQGCRLYLSFSLPPTAFQSLGLPEPLPFPEAIRENLPQNGLHDKADFHIWVRTEKAQVKLRISCGRKSMKNLYEFVRAMRLYGH